MKTDPSTRPPCTAQAFQAKLDEVKKTVDGIEWALATDADGKLGAGAYVEANNLIKALTDQVLRLTQPLREVETPDFDREGALLAAVDRLSPSTRYGYVRYADLVNASPDARYNPHFMADGPGRRYWVYPLQDLLEKLVDAGILERSVTGDYRRPGAKGQGKRVGQG